MYEKIKEIIENEMDCLITDVDFVIKKEGNLQALVNMLEVAINYTRCSTLLPDELQPVLAKIEHTNSLGTSNYWEVVYYDNKNWHSYQGSKTFEDGEKVVKWNYCKAIV